jgi:hypothetical protein
LVSATGCLLRAFRLLEGLDVEGQSQNENQNRAANCGAGAGACCCVRVSGCKCVWVMENGKGESAGGRPVFHPGVTEGELRYGIDESAPSCVVHMRLVTRHLV